MCTVLLPRGQGGKVDTKSVKGETCHVKENEKQKWKEGNWNKKEMQKYEVGSLLVSERPGSGVPRLTVLCTVPGTGGKSPALLKAGAPRRLK